MHGDSTQTSEVSLTCGERHEEKKVNEVAGGASRQ